MLDDRDRKGVEDCAEGSEDLSSTVSISSDSDGATDLRDSSLQQFADQVGKGTHLAYVHALWVVCTSNWTRSSNGPGEIVTQYRRKRRAKIIKRHGRKHTFDEGSSLICDRKTRHDLRRDGRAWLAWLPGR